MKKIINLFLILFISMILVGCTNTNDDNSNNNGSSKTKETTCTKETTDEDGYKTTDTLVITHDSKVRKVKNTNSAETDPTMIDFTYSFGQLFAEAFNKIDGFNVNYSKENNNIIKYEMIVDYDKIDVNALKETLGDMYDENTFYSESNVTYEEFKNNNLTDYTCK